MRANEETYGAEEVPATSSAAEETLGFRMDLGADKNTTTTVGDERAEMEPVAA